VSEATQLELQVVSPLQDKLEELLGDLALIRPYLRQSRRDAGLALEVRLEEGSILFRLTGSVAKESARNTITVEPEEFRELLFIDFTRWPTPTDFVEFVRGIDWQRNRSHDIDPDLLRRWYRLVHASAKRFFESPNALKDYFVRQHFASHWIRETNKTRHQLYIRLLERKIDARGTTVLDMGAGFGRLHQALVGARRVISVDISESMLRLCHARSTNGTLLCRADVHRMPFKERSIDLIVTAQLMMHLPKPFAVLSQLASLLTKSGELWTDFTCSGRPIVGGYYQESLITRVYSAEYVLRECGQAGLRVLGQWRVTDRLANYWLILRLQEKIE